MSDDSNYGDRLNEFLNDDGENSLGEFLGDGAAPFDPSDIPDEDSETREILDSLRDSDSDKLEEIFQDPESDPSAEPGVDGVGGGKNPADSIKKAQGGDSSGLGAPSDQGKGGRKPGVGPRRGDGARDTAAPGEAPPHGVVDPERDRGGPPRHTSDTPSPFDAPVGDASQGASVNPFGDLAGPITPLNRVSPFGDQAPTGNLPPGKAPTDKPKKRSQPRGKKRSPGKGVDSRGALGKFGKIAAGAAGVASAAGSGAGIGKAATGAGKAAQGAAGAANAAGGPTGAAGGAKPPGGGPGGNPEGPSPFELNKADPVSESAERPVSRGAINADGDYQGSDTSEAGFRADPPSTPRNKAPGGKSPNKGLKVLLAALMVALIAGVGGIVALGSMGLGAGLMDDQSYTAPCYDGSSGVDADDAANNAGSRGVPEGDFSKPEVMPPSVETSPFGPRGGAPHNGIDIADGGDPHAPIYAFYDGDVVTSETSDPTGYGQWIRIRHDIDGEEIYTTYGHMIRRHVQVGDKVLAGQHIADQGTEGGSTGPHVHFQVEPGGSPIDPKPWVDKALNPDPAGGLSSEGSNSGDSSSGGSGRARQISRTESTDKESPENPEVFPEANLKPGAIRLGRAVASKFPEIKTIGGYRESDPYPDHPSGRALDIMIPNYSSSSGRALGDKIVAYIMDNKEAYGLDYMIWKQEYIDYDGNKNLMGDRGDDTQNHFDHIHVLLTEESDNLSGAIKAVSSEGAVNCCVLSEASVDSDDTSSGTNSGADDVSEAIERNVKTIIGAGKFFNLSEDDIVVTIMTALVESELRNLANDGSDPRRSPGAEVPAEELQRSLSMPNDGVASDHASVGLLQQQVWFWGTVEDLMKPAYQVGQFMAKIEPTKASMGDNPPLGPLAQAIQISALPHKYAMREAEARELYSRFSGSAELSGDEEKDAQAGWDRISDGQDSETSSGSGDSAKVVNEKGCATRSDSDSGSTGYASEDAKKVIEEVKKHLGKPYVWGAAGPDTFDCSGLFYYSFNEAIGMDITRTTGTQVEAANGKKIEQSELEPGDLIYRAGDGGHVWMYLGDDEVIHAPQSGDVVKIVGMDQVQVGEIRRFLH